MLSGFLDNRVVIGGPVLGYSTVGLRRLGLFRLGHHGVQAPERL